MPRRRPKNKKYSPELKIAVVEAYLSGKGSMEELAKKSTSYLTKAVSETG